MAAGAGISALFCDHQESQVSGQSVDDSYGLQISVHEQHTVFSWTPSEERGQKPHPLLGMGWPETSCTAEAKAHSRAELRASLLCSSGPWHAHWHVCAPRVAFQLFPQRRQTKLSPPQSLWNFPLVSYPGRGSGAWQGRRSDSPSCTWALPSPENHLALRNLR